MVDIRFRCFLDFIRAILVNKDNRVFAETHTMVLKEDQLPILLNTYCNYLSLGLYLL